MGKYNRIKESITRVFETVVGQLVAALFIATVIAYISWDFILSVAKYVFSVSSHMMQINVPLWVTLLVIGSIILLKYALDKTSDMPLPFGYYRPRNGNEIERPLQHNGLNWSVYTPHQRLGRDEYVWVNGPFCPSCNFELKLNGLMKKSWVCARCGVKIKTRMKNAYDEEEHIKQIAYADIYRKNKFEKN